MYAKYISNYNILQAGWENIDIYFRLKDLKPMCLSAPHLNQFLINLFNKIFFLYSIIMLSTNKNRSSYDGIFKNKFFKRKKITSTSHKLIAQ